MKSLVVLLIAAISPEAVDAQISSSFGRLSSTLSYPSFSSVSSLSPSSYSSYTPTSTLSSYSSPATSYYTSPFGTTLTSSTTPSMYYPSSSNVGLAQSTTVLVGTPASTTSKLVSVVAPTSTTESTEPVFVEGVEGEEVTEVLAPKSVDEAGPQKPQTLPTQPLTPTSVFLPSISSFTNTQTGLTTVVSAFNPNTEAENDRRQVTAGYNVYKKDSPGTSTTTTYSPATSIYSKVPASYSGAATYGSSSSSTASTLSSIYSPSAQSSSDSRVYDSGSSSASRIYGSGIGSSSSVSGVIGSSTTGARQVVSYDFDGTIHKCESPNKCPNNPQVWQPNWDVIERIKNDNENYDIVVTTARKPRDNNKLWQFLWMVGIGDIIKGIYNSETKVEVLAKLGAIAHHDDNEKHLEDIEQALPQVDSFEADPRTGSMSVYTKKGGSRSSRSSRSRGGYGGMPGMGGPGMGGPGMGGPGMGGQWGR